MEEERDSYGYSKFENIILGLLMQSAIAYSMTGHLVAKSTPEQLREIEMKIYDTFLEGLKKSGYSIVPFEKSAIERLMNESK